MKRKEVKKKKKRKDEVRTEEGKQRDASRDGKRGGEGEERKRTKWRDEVGTCFFTAVMRYRSSMGGQSVTGNNNANRYNNNLTINNKIGKKNNNNFKRPASVEGRRLWVWEE